jgi:hypothetical protein
MLQVMLECYSVVVAKRFEIIYHLSGYFILQKMNKIHFNCEANVND